MKKSFIGWMSAVCLTVVLLPATAAADRYVMVFEEESIHPEEAARLIEAYGATLVREHFEIGVAIVNSDDSRFERRLAGDARVSGIGRDTRDKVTSVRVSEGSEIETIAATDSDLRAGSESSNGVDPTQAPLFPLQWDLRRIQAPEAWAEGFLGAPHSTIALLGTGIDYTHPELADKVDLNRSRSFVPSDDILVEQLFPGAHPIADLAFHSTYVAGMITCNVFQMGCVAPNSTLIGVKVQDLNEQGTIGDLVSGILYASKIRADVIAAPFAYTLDFADPDDKPLIRALRRAILKARIRGSVVLAEASAPPFMPGIDADADGTDAILPAQAGATTIAATGSLDQWSGISNFGFTLVDLSAPGGWVDPVTNIPPMNEAIIGPCSRFTQFGNLATICSMDQPPRYIFIVGSIPATAHAAGVAALIDSRFPYWHGFFQNWWLHRTADDILDPGRDVFSGRGRINALRAVTDW